MARRSWSRGAGWREPVPTGHTSWSAASRTRPTMSATGWLNDRVGAVSGEVRARESGEGFDVVIDVAELVWEPIDLRERLGSCAVTGTELLASPEDLLARRAPASRRRGRVHDARRTAPGDDAADRPDVRVVPGRRRRGRAGRMAWDPAGTRQVRGPIVAQDMDVPDPREHRQDAGAARRTEPAVLVARRATTRVRPSPESWFRGAG